MASIIKVDQIQSDSGTINVASNIGTAGNFAITGNLTASGMSSPTGTINVSSNMATTGNVSFNGKSTINSDGRQFSVIGAGTTLFEEYKCRAWCNFNGTGTPAIRGSGNVSSITDNGTGDYTVNFTTAMPDANYVATTQGRMGNTDVGTSFSGGFGISSLAMVSRQTDGTSPMDAPEICVAIFR